MRRLPIERETELRKTCPHGAVLGYGRWLNMSEVPLDFANKLFCWQDMRSPMMGLMEDALYACAAEDFDAAKDLFDRPWENEEHAR